MLLDLAAFLFAKTAVQMMRPNAPRLSGSSVAMKSWAPCFASTLSHLFREAPRRDALVGVGRAAPRAAGRVAPPAASTTKGSQQQQQTSNARPCPDRAPRVPTSRMGDASRDGRRSLGFRRALGAAVKYCRPPWVRADLGNARAATGVR